MIVWDQKWDKDKLLPEPDCFVWLDGKLFYRFFYARGWLWVYHGVSRINGVVYDESGFTSLLLRGLCSFRIWQGARESPMEFLMEQML